MLNSLTTRRSSNPWRRIDPGRASRAPFPNSEQSVDDDLCKIAGANLENKIDDPTHGVLELEALSLIRSRNIWIELMFCVHLRTSFAQRGGGERIADNF